MGSSPVNKIGYTSEVTAYGQTRTVAEWIYRPECFVTKQAFYQRLRSLETEAPTEEQVEAALCLNHHLWRFYRQHGYVPNYMVTELKVHDTTYADHTLSPLELSSRIRKLTPKRRHVLLLQTRKHSTSSIAAATKISSPTVRTYSDELISELGLADFDDWRLSEPEVQMAFNDHIAWYVNRKDP